MKRFIYITPSNSAMGAISKLKKTILGIAIAIVLAFFLGYAVNTFYEEPDSNEFCEDIDLRIEVESCEDYELPMENREPYPVPVKECSCYEVDKEGNKKCEATNPEYQQCMEQYSDVRENHGRFSFILLTILGLASILIGGLVLKVEAVSSGIMGGGVLTLIYASLRYWGSIQDYARLIILGVTLGILVWIGYKKFKR